MNLYKISQTENTGYDTFDSAIVAADSIEEAAAIHPFGSEEDVWESDELYQTWASSPDKVVVILVGKAAPGVERGILISSYNAG